GAGPKALPEQGGVHQGRPDRRRRHPDAEVSPEPGQVPAPRTAEENGAEQRHEGDAAQDAEEHRSHHTNPRQGTNVKGQPWFGGRGPGHGPGGWSLRMASSTLLRQNYRRSGAAVTAESAAPR